MNKTVRALLSVSKVREALARNDLDFVYDMIATNSERSDLTVFLLEIGIDPLDYISKIWWGMYSHVNVEINEIIIPDKITEIENFAYKKCLYISLTISIVALLSSASTSRFANLIMNKKAEKKTN